MFYIQAFVSLTNYNDMHCVESAVKPQPTSDFSCSCSSAFLVYYYLFNGPDTAVGLQWVCVFTW